MGTGIWRDLRTMDARIFRDEPMGIAHSMAEMPESSLLQAFITEAPFINHLTLGDVAVAVADSRAGHLGRNAGTGFSGYGVKLLM